MSLARACHHPSDQKVPLPRSAHADRLPLLVCVLVGLLSASGFVSRYPPEASDTLFHLMRAVQIDALIHEGVLFSRWAPDMVWGYGYPLFNYYSPLAYYIVSLVNLVAHDIALSGNIAMALILILTPVGMYLWVSELSGRLTGVFAALFVTYSSYWAVNAYARYVFPELAALSLVPVELYLQTRAIASGNGRLHVAASVALAAIVLFHNTTGLLFAPVALTYGLCMSLTSSGGVQRALRARRFLGSLILGVALSAWYWGPAIVEGHLVQLDRLTAMTVFDYRANFLQLGKLFTVPQSPTAFLQNPVPSMSVLWLHPLTVLCAGVGLASSLLQRSDDRAPLLMLCALSAVYVFFAVEYSERLWYEISFMRLLQFPWRFLGLATILLAAVAGRGLAALATWHSHTPVVSVWPTLVSCLVWFTVVASVSPWQYAPVRLRWPGRITIEDVRMYGEHQVNIGTTTTGEYLPVDVRELPDAVAASTERATRFQTSSLPTGAVLLRVQTSAKSESLDIYTPTSFTAMFNTFYFSGWRAAVDGSPATIVVGSPSGLINVPVPAGTHTITLRFGTNRTRSGFVLVSAAAAAWLASMCYVYSKRRYRNSDSYQAPLGEVTPIQSLFFGLATLCSIAFVWAGLRLPQTSATYHEVTCDATFGGTLKLIGVSIPEGVTGRDAAIQLVWQTDHAPTARLSASVLLVDESGQVLSRSDNLHPGGKPTDEWLPSPHYVRDDHVLYIPRGTAPGIYSAKLIVTSSGTPQRWAAGSGDSRLVHEGVFALGEIVVREGSSPRIQHPVNAEFGGQVILVGYDLLPAYSGEEASLKLYWRMLRSLEDDYSVSVRLVDGKGHLVSQQDHKYLAGHPGCEWISGTLYEEAFDLPLPAGLAPGDYAISVSVYTQHEPYRALDAISDDGAAHGQSPQLGNLHVRKPFRMSDPDELPITDLVDYTLEPGLVYLGHEPYPDDIAVGEALRLQLYWLAESGIGSVDEVTLQMRELDGTVVAEQQTSPVPDWPTRSWKRGDVWRGIHDIQVPAYLDAGPFSLDLISKDGSRHVRLGEIHVEAPERMYEAPNAEHDSSDRLGDLAVLVGYTAPAEAQAGDAVPVELVWLAQDTSRTGYKSFVQVLDEHGVFVAGSDMVPGDWLRPTTGWARGEYVVDHHTISLPDSLGAGEYTLVVGMYSEDTGQRVISDDGTDLVRLLPGLRVGITQ